jgi:hypothetical protein
MDKSTVQKLKDAIAKSISIGIAVGSNPSIDEMGAALSLYLLLKTANKSVSIASPSDPIVEISSLVGIDKVQKRFGGSAGDLVVSFPYKEGEIEKVSYTLENNFLNIIVKASEQGLSFDDKEVRYSRGSGDIDLLIVVGTAALADIGDVIDSQKLANTSVINIDNDPNNAGFGDIVIISPQASSVSEHVADISLILGFSIGQDAAQNMLSGIMHSTNNFQDSKTSSLAFEIASILMKSGAQRLSNQRSTNNVHASPAVNHSFMTPQQQPEEQQPQPVQQPMQSNLISENSDRVEQPEEQNEKPPLDWLSPKVYKGSSEV